MATTTNARSMIDPLDPRVMSGAIWQQVLDAMKRAERFVLASDVPASPLMRAEGMRFLTRLFAGGLRLCVELGDPDYPELGRMVETFLSWGIDNPDCIYLYASVRGDATYRISGNRGTAHHFDIQLQRGHFAIAPDFGVITSLNSSDLQVAPDGSIEIVISPEAHGGNWLRSAPDAQWFLIRQYFYDWERERPADLVIQRDGAEYPPPPLRTDQIAARLQRLIQWCDVGCGYWDLRARQSLNTPPNSCPFQAVADGEWGGLKGLAYGLGNFRCQPDEAVILEVRPPRCHYWSFGLGNFYWESLDWTRRQTSLNERQARLDSDGIFRAVIAHSDPGVPNWLDTQGHTWGTINGRYLLTDASPEPLLHTVKLANVRAALPADTPSVSPAQRSEMLRRRERAAHRRNRH